MRATIMSWARTMGCVGVVIGIAGCGSTAADKTAAVPWDALSDSRFLEGSSQQTGDYRGTLVLLPCDLTKGGDGQTHCAPGTRRPALMIPSDTVVHPLMAGSPALQQKLTSPALVGKKVVITGILYPDLKVIYVGDINLDT